MGSPGAVAQHRLGQGGDADALGPEAFVSEVPFRLSICTVPSKGANLL